jgi:hypothetical protein
MIRQVRPEDRQAVESKSKAIAIISIPPLFSALQQIAHDFYDHLLRQRFQPLPEG